MIPLWYLLHIHRRFPNIPGFNLRQLGLLCKKYFPKKIKYVYYLFLRILERDHWVITWWNMTRIFWETHFYFGSMFPSIFLLSNTNSNKALYILKNSKENSFKCIDKFTILFGSQRLRKMWELGLFFITRKIMRGFRWVLFEN